MPLTLSRSSTAMSMASSCPSVVRSVRSDRSSASGGHAYKAKDGTRRIVPFRSVSRPSTTSLSRPSTTSVSRPSTTSLSRPSTASTQKSSVSKRLDVIRDTSRANVPRASRPVSGSVIRKMSPSQPRPQTATSFTPRSRTLRNGSAKTQNESNKAGEISPRSSVPSRTYTSNDILVHLFNIWQPQLCSSYRTGVKYVPTTPKQMRFYVDAMLLDKKRSHHLNRFRAVGRVAESIARFNQHNLINDGVDTESLRSLKQSNDDQSPGDKSWGDTDHLQHLQKIHEDGTSFSNTTSNSLGQHSNNSNTHLMGHQRSNSINHHQLGQYLGSSNRKGLHSSSLGNISFSQLLGRQHQRLQKSMSHGQFKLKE
ncbi:serine-rich adhesin for platelets-like [Haliotis rubra]|uniref:serine-rich adhesin for platelets-like n=1 Tax=Haliotis rubra TaxID=36100 RepID=UPI001EE5C9C7|nr:serine-rich adhesin for platelets-like [Haliotis rubra]